MRGSGRCGRVRQAYEIKVVLRDHRGEVGTSVIGLEALTLSRPNSSCAHRHEVSRLALSVPSFVPSSRPESTGAGRSPPQQPYSAGAHRRLAAIPVCGTKSHLVPNLSTNRGTTFQLYPHSYPQTARASWPSRAVLSECADGLKAAL